MDWYILVMKVLIVGPSNSQHCIRWINRLIERKCSVVLIDMFEGDTSDLNEKCYRILMKKITPKAWRMIDCVSKVKFLAPLLEWIPIRIMSTQLSRWVIQEKIDLINVHWMLHPYAITAAMQKAIPVISTPWGSDVLLPHYRGGNLLKVARRIYAMASLRKVVKGSSKFICDATHLKKALIKLGAQEDDISLIYFGTDTKFFCPSLRSEEFRTKFGASEIETVVLSNRGLDDIYQIWVLIEAIPKVLKRYETEQIRFWFAGSGKDRQALENLVDSLNLTKYVTFLGRLSDEDFARATASCDLYVSTSPTDGGLSASVAEAMSCEKPVVISRFGDNPSWLDNESAGLLFAPGNPTDLADKLLELLGDYEKQKEMGKIGRQIILKRNNAVLETDKVISAYQRLLS